MPIITQFDRHKIVLLHQQGILKELFAKTWHISAWRPLCTYNIEEVVEDKIYISCLKNYRGWTVYEKKRKSSKDLRDASGPSVDPSAVSWNIIRYGLIQWKDGCQEAIFKEEWQGGKVEVCYITQELDWESVSTGLMEGSGLQLKILVVD